MKQCCWQGLAQKKANELVRLGGSVVGGAIGSDIDVANGMVPADGTVVVNGKAPADGSSDYADGSHHILGGWIGQTNAEWTAW